MVQDLRVVFSSISRNEEHIQKPASLTCERAVAPPQIARMAAEHATNDQVVCIKELCDESERLAEAGEDYSADTAFHNAIAESSGNLVVPRLMGVLKASVPLFIDVTGKKLVEETIRTHRNVADRIMFMDGGVVVEEGPAKQLIEHPQEERTKQFLAHYSE